jgi:ribosome assembly protein RRB1
LHFEDRFPEEYIIEDGEHGDDDEEDYEEVEDPHADKMVVTQPWDPLRQNLEPGMELEMDAAAYKMYHAVPPEWPALSFDFIRDDLGHARTRFPHSCIAAVGTQAQRPDQNQLTIIKLSDLAKTHLETEDDILGDEYNLNKKDKEHDTDDEDSDTDSDDAELDCDPIMENYSIPHRGGVNRVRCMPQSPSTTATVVATWSDMGQVHLYNVESILLRFAAAEGKQHPHHTSPPTLAIPTKPFFSFTPATVRRKATPWTGRW